MDGQSHASETDGRTKGWMRVSVRCLDVSKDRRTDGRAGVCLLVCSGIDECMVG